MTLACMAASVVSIELMSKGPLSKIRRGGLDRMSIPGK
jgi:hypothetical protein